MKSMKMDLQREHEFGFEDAIGEENPFERLA